MPRNRGSETLEIPDSRNLNNFPTSLHPQQAIKCPCAVLHTAACSKLYSPSTAARCKMFHYSYEKGKPEGKRLLGRQY
jgi:hypothetical protein